MDTHTNQRMEGILSAIEHQGAVSVAELSASFGVSAVTIRKDLEALERRSLLERTRGGARSRTPGEEGSFSDRIGRNVAAKKAIARRAAQLVRNGDIIGLDSSTTGYYLAMEIADRRELTVVTNSLRSASLLADESDATIILLGGTIRRTSDATVGAPTDLLSGRGRLHRSFLGLSALSLERGMLEMSVAEADSKRTLVAISDEVVGIFDSSKARGFGLHSVVDAAGVSRLITDDEFAPDEAAAWEQLGTVVDRCPVIDHQHHVRRKAH